MMLRSAKVRALLLRWSMAADRRWAGSEPEGLDYARWEKTGVSEAETHEYEARLREVPDDTRDLTARVCGDPLPGRSALARSEVQAGILAERRRGMGRL